MYPQQQFYDPSVIMLQPNFNPANQMPINQPMFMNQKKAKGAGGPSMVSRIPSLHLPAIILLAFSWLLHAIATFIPYWSVYSGISDSRAGLWSARNFNYTTIQNFYFPNPYTFSNITSSLRFTTANTKGYLITVQFLMTFNFCFMFIVIVLLAVDFIVAQSSSGGSRSFLIRNYNTSDTVLKYALLLYIIYVFGVFEFAAWITFVGSRHDNNWHMHVSFAFTVIVSVFLVVVFILYVIEFVKIFEKPRTKWEYWYGRYIEWGFFVFLSALLLALLVICCPEWAYDKISSLNVFGEIGLFKQCYLSQIYKKTLSSGLCTLSSSSSNKAWVNATQAFMLMAYIFGMLILFVIVIFRKEFRHNAQGYVASRVSQPNFTFIIAGLILFFCFIFSLIAVSIFGGEVFKYPLTANWGYIVAVFVVVLFFIAGILFILDAVHSGRQAAADSSPAKKFFFPAPLDYRVLATKPLQPRPAIPPAARIRPVAPLQQYEMVPQQMIPPSFFPPQQMISPSFFPPQQTMMPPVNYGMDPALYAPLTQATLANYFLQMQNNPQLTSSPFNQGLMNYSGGYPFAFSDNRNNIVGDNTNRLNDMVRQTFIQQQRLNYNHELLLERYSRLHTPRIAEFQTFGGSSLPGRNYDAYLQSMRGYDNYGPEDTIAAQSRAGIGSSDEAYRWMGGNDSYEPLPRGVSSTMQHSRDDPTPFVRAEKFEPVKIYNHPIFGPTPAYIRPVYKKTKDSKINDEETDSEAELINSDYEEEKKPPITTTTKNNNDDVNEISDHIPLGYLSYQNWKTKHENLIPVNPLLFNIYTQRSNGSIESYGQSLYVPSRDHSPNRRPSHYDDISIPPPSDTDSVLADVTHTTSSSSKKHRYNKLHSQPSSTTVSHRPSEPFITETNNDLSGKETSRSRPSDALLSQNSSNSITPSALPTSHIALPASTTTPTPMAGALLTQNTSTMNNAGTEQIPPSLSSNPLGILNIPSISVKKPESVSTSTSIVLYQTISSIHNDSTTVAPKSNSTQISSNQKKLDSFNNAPVDDAISNSSDSDDDDDHDETKKKRKQQKKKSMTTTDGNADINSSSSDD